MSEYAHGEPQLMKVFIPCESFQLHLFATFLCQEQSIKPCALHYCLSFLIFPLFHSGKKKEKRKLRELRLLTTRNKKERNQRCEGRTLERRGFLFQINNTT